MAAQNKPFKEEHIHLRNFLVKLAKGNTFVVIGSHGGLDWLAMDTFHDNIHFLFGLDAEAISLLTDHILRKNQVNNYREDEDLQQILKLLEGFPQAMEVVLANLASQTPREVLQHLKSGSIEVGHDHVDKSATGSIKSSHRRLSPEAQQLLLCLAPFTSVINISPPASNHIIAQLRQQPLLVAFPFDYWSRAMQEAQDVGLLSPDSTISPGFLRLHPLLPCFLREYLSTAEQREVIQAVEQAFREHYQQVGLQLNQLLTSQDLIAKQSGLAYVSLEFENLMTGLNLALVAETSVAACTDALMQFLIMMHDLPRGLALCQHILAHFEQLSVDTIGGPLGFELANTLGFMSHWLFELKQYAMVEASCQGILQLTPHLTQLDEKRGNMLAAHASLQLGMLKDEQRDFLVASHYYEQAMQIYKKFNDLYSQATVYHNMGAMAQAQGQYRQAKEWYLQALQLKEDPVSKADTDYQLGLLAIEQRQFSQAEQHCRRALDGFVPYSLRYACVYYHLGIVAQEQQQLAQAEKYYQHALKGFITYNDYHKQAGSYIHLGQVMQEQQHHQEAREYFLLALKTFRFYGDMNSSAIAFNNLARFWKVSGDMTLPAAIAPLIGFSGQETEELFRRVTEHVMIQEASSTNVPERW